MGMFVSRDLVVVTDSTLDDDDVYESVLKRAGLGVRRAQCHTPEQVRTVARDAAALIVQWAPIDRSVIQALPKLRFISRLGIGTDMIDIEAATDAGVAVANTPDYCVSEVASHSVALILAAARCLRSLDEAVRQHNWQLDHASYPTRRLEDLTAAVLGFGRIGRRVAAQLAALGMRVLVHDPYVSHDAIVTHGHGPVDFDGALRNADFVSLHLPLADQTRGIIDDAAIELMRPGGYLINTCRGGLVDEAALVAALETGRLAGAALDVFHEEPLPEDHVLLRLPNVQLSPHAAWFSSQSSRDLPRLAAAQVARFTAGEAVDSILNPRYQASTSQPGNSSPATRDEPPALEA